MKKLFHFGSFHPKTVTLVLFLAGCCVWAAFCIFLGEKMGMETVYYDIAKDAPQHPANTPVIPMTEWNPVKGLCWGISAFLAGALILRFAAEALFYPIAAAYRLLHGDVAKDENKRL